MSWKKWPYWLRGGVIGGGIALILSILSITSEHLANFLSFLFFPSIWLATGLGGGIGFFLVSYFPFASLVVLAETTLIWFAVGSLIGKIIERIKKRKGEG